jgi:hypothetical protein
MISTPWKKELMKLNAAPRQAREDLHLQKAEISRLRLRRQDILILPGIFY